MNKINFKNLPDTTTPLSAENLNLLQDNVEDAIPTLDSTVSTSSTNGVENQAITNYVNSAIPEVKTTQTTSDTATYSCTYINNNAGGISGWTLLGTETGNTDISLPSSYNEILIIVEAVSSSARTWNVGTFPKIYIDGMTENHAFRNGHYDTSSDYSACAVWIKTDKKVSLAGTSYNGTSQTGRIYVYYR